MQAYVKGPFLAVCGALGNIYLFRTQILRIYYFIVYVDLLGYSTVL